MASSNVIFFQQFTQLQAFKADWDRLSFNVPTPLLTYDWIVTAAKIFHDKDQLYIGVLFEDKIINGIIPLIVQGKGLKRELRLAGISNLGEAGGVLFRNPIVFEKLLESSRSLGVPLFLENIPMQQAQLPNICPISISLKGLHIWKPSNSSCYLTIDKDWETYWASLPSKRRNDIRRARKRAQSYGDIQFSICCPTAEELKSTLARAFRIEANSWKSKNQSSIEANPRLKIFFTEIAASMQSDGCLQIGLLTIDGSDAAMLIGLEYANRFWLLKIGYDQRWRKCSPGILLVTESIQHAFNRRLSQYEFLGSYEPWLRTWVRGDSFHQYGIYAFYPFKLPGIVRFLSHVTGQIRKLL